MGTNGDETERVRDLSHGRLRQSHASEWPQTRSDYATSETSSIVIKATIHCTVVLVAFSSTVLVAGRSDTLSTVWRVFVGSVSVVWGRLDMAKPLPDFPKISRPEPGPVSFWRYPTANGCASPDHLRSKDP
jgi:hypothetical protein